VNVTILDDYFGTLRTLDRFGSGTVLERQNWEASQ
jgi:hypothetical protein